MKVKIDVEGSRMDFDIPPTKEHVYGTLCVLRDYLNSLVYGEKLWKIEISTVLRVPFTNEYLHKLLDKTGATLDEKDPDENGIHWSLTFDGKSPEEVEEIYKRLPGFIEENRKDRGYEIEVEI